MRKEGIMNEFFKRGPYGEIIPPALVNGTTPDEAIGNLAAAVKLKSGEDMEQPRSGRSGEGLLRIAAAHTHAHNLLRALQGELWTPDAIALRVFVEQIGEAISLRPLYLDDLYFQTFVPVFQREGESGEQWRVGTQGQGKTKLLPGSCAEAFAKAQAVYAQWAADEEEKLTAWLKQKTTGMAVNVFILCWQLQLEKAGRVDVQDGFCLEHWGTHSTYVLTTPKGIRILRASSDELAAKYAYMIVSKQLKQPPSPRQVIDALLTRIPMPQKDGSNWRVSGAAFAFLPHGRAAMNHNGNSYDITFKGDMVSVKKNGRKFRRLEFPNGGEWDDPKERSRILLGWCGLLTVES